MRALLMGVAVLGLLGSGGVVAAALQDAPQDAQPATPDPIGDLLRDPPQTSGTPTTPVEPAPSADLAPASPIVVVPTDPLVVAILPEDGADKADATEEVPAKLVEPVVPNRRQRRRVAIVEAIDKVTAQSMRFEVEVGGRPVRFNKQLVFTARACEVSAPEELVEDSVAYLEISVEPRASARNVETRQVFKGWMFASTPAVSGLEHPIYDAWIVGCKA
ncbi:DUF2155 domain-containing protein [Brevundimonas variabilis]|nr:DUF2155 domain-containing protein [Brevundimonas variabilis]